MTFEEAVYPIKWESSELTLILNVCLETQQGDPASDMSVRDDITFLAGLRSLRSPNQPTRNGTFQFHLLRTTSFRVYTLLLMCVLLLLCVLYPVCSHTCLYTCV